MYEGGSHLTQMNNFFILSSYLYISNFVCADRQNSHQGYVAMGK